MEFNETPKPKVFEIEAPERLEKGQNFYDQQPFDGILNKQSTALNIEKPQLAYVLTSFAKAQVREYLRAHGGDLTNLDLARFMINRNKSSEAYRLLEKNFKIDRAERERYLSAIPNFLASFSDLPSWSEYIHEQMYSSHYLPDGEYKEQENQFGTAESYGAWINRKYTSAQRQMLLGMQDVFPQDLGSESTPQVASGKRLERKRWRILAASEMTRPR